MSIDRAVLFRLATSTRFEQAVRAVPGGERAAWRPAARYVAGPAPDDALTTASALADKGIGSSVDMFGELVTDPATGAQVTARYLELAARIGGLPRFGLARGRPVPPGPGCGRRALP